MIYSCNSESDSRGSAGSDILIVEDSEFVNNTVKTELEKLGHHCVQAFTLEEALQSISLMGRCDYIILDLNLPDAYGEGLFSTLKIHSEAKIIILTSEEDAQVRSSLFKLGALDYILKDKNFIESILKTEETIRKISKNIGFNVLVIDDSTLLRKHIEMVLEVRNYTVLQAGSAQEGLNVLKSESVDLIILDLELPDMHGSEVLHLIKNDPTVFMIPVMILSGTNNPELVSSVLKGGAADFIQKPFNVEEFVLKIDLWSQLTNSAGTIHYLQQLVKEYKNAIDQCAIVSITDPKGILTHVNDMFCKVSGYSEEELIGRPHNIVRHPDMPDTVFEELWKTIEDKKTWSGRLKNKKKNAESYTTDTVITPIVDTCGNIIEYIATYRVDSTDTSD